MLVAKLLSVESDPIWSTSTEFDVVVNVVMVVISSTADNTIALDELAVELAIFEFLVDTLLNFSRDLYKLIKIVLSAFELVLQVAMYTIDLSS